MADYRGVYDAPDDAFCVLAELDAFDMLSKCDRPQTIVKVRKWFPAAALTDVVVRPGHKAGGRRHR